MYQYMKGCIDTFSSVARMSFPCNEDSLSYLTYLCNIEAFILQMTTIAHVHAPQAYTSSFQVYSSNHLANITFRP
ncbi:Uncharacterized protein TCM_009044 [Theobroma cacao]|uniref:Uncharacterized protein n=1 Tax=Theobroma cacao TaxID=3641 RepID=A0A061ECE3_THECC|nr:Uncharacterized protein TCM_009044 [Theobroma cacao]